MGLNFNYLKLSLAGAKYIGTEIKIQSFKLGNKINCCEMLMARAHSPGCARGAYVNSISLYRLYGSFMTTLVLHTIGPSCADVNKLVMVSFVIRSGLLGLFVPVGFLRLFRFYWPSRDDV